MQSINNIIKRTAGYFLFGAAFALTSCTDVVDKRDLGNVVDEVVWNDPNLITNYFNNTMAAGLPGGEARLLGHADECFQNNAGVSVLNDGLTVETTDGGGGWANLDRWPYETLRKINRFLDHAEYDNFVTTMPMTSKLAKSAKEDMVGQMLVLRAYHYFDLLRTYGGVPLLLHEQPASNEFADMYSSRSKTSECVAQIVNDLNAAIALPDASFPMKRGDGHIGKGAAYALKGRVLLYYASPQFIAPRGGAKPAGTKSEAERWSEAYNACKEAYDKLTAAGFGLYAPDGGDKKTVIDNYYKMLVSDKMNKEMIWVRKHESQIWSFGQDRDFRPGSSGGSGIAPIWEMASAFSNADGTPFTRVKVNQNNTQGGMGDIVEGTSKRPNETPVPDGSPINKSEFWRNREPRFYAFIGYNGGEYPLVRKLQNEFSADVKSGQMQHEWLFCWGNNTDFFPFDRGGRFDFGGGAGFCIRKFVNAGQNYELTSNDQLAQSSTDWPLFRFAEIVLNYAEAAAKHPGHTQEAYDMLDALRKRAGIPSDNGYGLGRKTGDALILDILNERKIELFLESQRYYDVRRWRLYSDALAGFKLNGTLRHCLQAWLIGIDPANAPSKQDMIAKIQTILNAGGIDTDAGVDAYFNVFFHVTMLHNNLPIAYNPDRQDFLRIPYDTHIRKNPTIEQTMGWTDERGPGKFNPWE